MTEHMKNIYRGKYQCDLCTKSFPSKVTGINMLPMYTETKKIIQNIIFVVIVLNLKRHEEKYGVEKVERKKQGKKY